MSQENATTTSTTSNPSGINPKVSRIIAKIQELRASQEKTTRYAEDFSQLSEFIRDLWLFELSQLLELTPEPTKSCIITLLLNNKDCLAAIIVTGDLHDLSVFLKKYPTLRESTVGLLTKDTIALSTILKHSHGHYYLYKFPELKISICKLTLNDGELLDAFIKIVPIDDFGLFLESVPAGTDISLIKDRYYSRLILELQNKNRMRFSSFFIDVIRIFPIILKNPSEFSALARNCTFGNLCDLLSSTTEPNKSSIISLLSNDQEALAHALESSNFILLSSFLAKYPTLRKPVVSLLAENSCLLLKILQDPFIYSSFPEYLNRLPELKTIIYKVVRDDEKLLGALIQNESLNNFEVFLESAPAGTDLSAIKDRYYISNLIPALENKDEYHRVINVLDLMRIFPEKTAHLFQIFLSHRNLGIDLFRKSSQGSICIPPCYSNVAQIIFRLSKPLTVLNDNDWKEVTTAISSTEKSSQRLTHTELLILQNYINSFRNSENYQNSNETEVANSEEFQSKCTKLMDTIQNRLSLVSLMFEKITPNKLETLAPTTPGTNVKIPVDLRERYYSFWGIPAETTTNSTSTTRSTSNNTSRRPGCAPS